MLNHGQQLILSNIGRHIQLNESEQKYFLNLLRPRTVRKKEYLLRSGELCKYDTFVTKGCLRCYDVDEGGTEHISMFAIEDWWTSDLYSFLTQTPARMNIDALEDTVVLQISKTDLEGLYRQVPKFERFFRIILQNAYVAFERRLVQNLSNTAEERFEAFNQKYPNLGQRIAQKHIAAYLGITPEFLSMLRKKAIGK